MEMIYSTQSAWTEDYLNENQSLESDQSLTKRRAPFVPFVLRNRTGCKLCFGTLTTSPTKAAGNAERQTIGRSKSLLDAVQAWREVEAGEEVPMKFESRDKMRHKVAVNFRMKSVTPVGQSCRRILDLTFLSS